MTTVRYLEREPACGIKNLTLHMLIEDRQEIQRSVCLEKSEGGRIRKSVPLTGRAATKNRPPPV